MLLFQVHFNDMDIIIVGNPKDLKHKKIPTMRGLRNNDAITKITVRNQQNEIMFQMGKAHWSKTPFQMCKLLCPVLTQQLPEIQKNATM